mmetsp:Transcript_97675/g.303723  ORF Transcript_97675/g.303723 Transcript_97675/m.303723 type:complete len:189 (+) Transcript_97675:370-936(+)
MRFRNALHISCTKSASKYLTRDAVRHKETKSEESMDGTKAASSAEWRTKSEKLLRSEAFGPGSAAEGMLRLRLPEVELPRAALEDLELAPEAAASGEATHCYQLAGVLASCLRAAKDAKAVKVRFNSEGVMSNQFILRGRGQRDLFCEALVSPLAESRGAARGTTGGAAPDNTPAKRKPYAAGESLGF